MRAKELLREIVRVLDKLDGAETPVHPLALKDKKKKYITYFALFLLLPFVIFVGGVTLSIRNFPDVTEGAFEVLVGLALASFCLETHLALY